MIVEKFKLVSFLGGPLCCVLVRRAAARQRTYGISKNPYDVILKRFAE